MKKNTSSKPEDKEKMVIIYSTFSGDMAYDMHDAINGKTTITISGICNANDDDKDSLLITPKSISSKVSLGTYELLKCDHVFSRHLQDGHIKIEYVDEEVQEDAAKDGAIEDKEKEEIKSDKDD